MSQAGSVSKHFSRASTVYDEEASLQRELARDLVRGIRLDTQPRRILDLGCGTGFLVRETVASFPESEITAIDISADMLDAARRLCPKAEQVSWMWADARELAFVDHFDLVVSNSAIQWMTPLGALFENIHRTLRPGGTFRFSVMLQGTLRELHGLRREVAPHKPPRAELPTQEESRAALAQVGFTVKECYTSDYRREYPSAAEFLQRIRLQGFTGGHVSTSRVALTRGELNRILDLYSSRFCNESGGVFASYNVGFFEAVR